MDGMCSAREASIRELVSHLAQGYTSLRENLQAEHAELEPGKHRRDAGAPLKFAVAFKSRCGKQEGQQVQKGATLATTPASAGSLTISKAAEEFQNRPKGSVPDEASSPAKDCSRCAGQPAGDAPAGSKAMGASKIGASLNSSVKAGSASGESPAAGLRISREVAVAAAAKGFSRACGDAGLMAEVNLKQPHTVICLDVLPVGASTIAAVSIVDSSACVLRPRLVLKALHACK